MIRATNVQIKLLRKLHDRKERQKSGFFYIEGLRIVGEALQTGAGIEFLVVAPALLTSTFGQQLIHRAEGKHIPILEVNTETFTGLSPKDGPQGVAAVVHQDWASLEQVSNPKGSPSPASLWIALDAVQDHGNLGTILRTSDAVGSAGVILLDHTTDPYDPATVRASMGAIFSQCLVKTSLSEFAAWKESHPIPVVGSSGLAESDYHQVHYPNPCILMMGSERQGLTEQHLRLCDMIVKIPMIGRSDSLNLAIATGVILYEIFNQRRS